VSDNSITTGPSLWWHDPAAFYAQSTSDYDYVTLATQSLDYFAQIFQAVDIFELGSTYSPYFQPKDTSAYGYDGSVAGWLRLTGAGFLGDSGVVHRLVVLGDNGRNIDLNGTFGWASGSGVTGGTANSISVSQVGSNSWNIRNYWNARGSFTVSEVGTVSGTATDILMSGADRIELEIKGSINVATGAGTINKLIFMGSTNSGDGSSYTGGGVSLSGRYKLSTILSAPTIGGLLDNAALFAGKDTFSTPDTTRAWHGFTGSDVMSGGSGNDHFYGDEGKDALDGNGGTDLLEGGVDNDTYIFHGIANEHVTIIETGGRDTLSLLLPADNFEGTLVAFVGDDLRISTPFGAQDVTIVNQRIAGDAQVETIKFADGFYAPLVNAPNVWTRGATGDDAVTLTSAHHIYAALSGNDDVTGTVYNDYVHGGAGNDTLRGGLGNDVLFGGDGNDALYGQGGYNNILFGGSGADAFVFDTLSAGAYSTIKDFSVVDGDKIDVRGLLTGFDPAHISYFVRFTLDGNNTAMSIDADGAVGGHVFTSVATLEGVRGLSVINLFASHNLIAS
jgi:Ca2+-binding RTX toxin-like protein